MELDIKKKYRETLKNEMSAEKMLSETIEPSDEVPDYEEMNKAFKEEEKPATLSIDLKAGKRRPERSERKDIPELEKGTEKTVPKPENAGEKNKQEGLQIIKEAPKDEGGDNAKRNSPKIIKKIGNDAQVKGRLISSEEVEKIKKIPEAYIIIHEKEVPVKENISLSSAAKRSQAASAGTQLLSEQSCGQLKREDSGEVVVISKPVFKIGKSAKFADYVITGNSAVSRKHAELITRNGRCYVRDKNSTNGTYVDDTQLPPETEMQLKPGEVLTIANVRFIFEVA